MKHKFSFKVTLWWLILLLILGVSLVFFGEKQPRDSLLENRRLAGFPEFSFGRLLSGEFMSDFESYLSDSFFGREELVTLSGDMMDVFSTQSEEDMLTADIGEDIESEFEGREDEDDFDFGETTVPEETPAEAQPTPEPEKKTVDIADSDRISVGSTDNERDEGYQRQNSYGLWLKQNDGGRKAVYSYTPESIEKLMEGLNAYRSVLPEDGTVHFALMPVAQTANWWTGTRDTYCGWESNAEEYMAALADDGVYIYNAPEILEPGLLDGEYLYYRTDHHWTIRGSYNVAMAMLKQQGLPVTRYKDYVWKTNTGYLGSIYSEKPSAALKAKADDIEIPSSLAPVHSYIVKQLEKSKEIGYMADYNNYLAYLQGTQTPWRRIVTGFHTGRNALVVADSFGNCFAPWLVPYYDEVHMVDLRKGNFTKEEAGALVGQYMERYGIDDVYVVLCTASGLAYNYTQEYLLKYLK